jgi:hypothetical protein
VAQDSIHSLKTSGCLFMIIKMDLAKAYDKINWDLLREMLGDFSFDPAWISWISSLISLALFLILANGSPSPPSMLP